MKKVTLRLSSTAPAPTWQADIVCTTPEQLVRAVKDTTLFCHYFDEDDNNLEHFEDALEHLGIQKAEMSEFKKRHGLFTMS